jgi:hypothetical protein
VFGEDGFLELCNFVLPEKLCVAVEDHWTGSGEGNRVNSSSLCRFIFLLL